MRLDGTALSATRISQHINAVGFPMNWGMGFAVVCPIVSHGQWLSKLHVSRLKALIKEMYGG
jgi:hypothetical protein